MRPCWQAAPEVESAFAGLFARPERTASTMEAPVRGSHPGPEAPLPGQATDRSRGHALPVDRPAREAEETSLGRLIEAPRVGPSRRLVSLAERLARAERVGGAGAGSLPRPDGARPPVHPEGESSLEDEVLPRRPLRPVR
jgi:hypothetical protein